MSKYTPSNNFATGAVASAVPMVSSVAPVHNMQHMALPGQMAVSHPMSLGAPLNMGSHFAAAPMGAAPMMMARPAMLPMGHPQMMMASPGMMAMRPQFANQGKPWPYLR